MAKKLRDVVEQKLAESDDKMDFVVITKHIAPDDGDAHAHEMGPGYSYHGSDPSDLDRHVRLHYFSGPASDQHKNHVKSYWKTYHGRTKHNVEFDD